MDPSQQETTFEGFCALIQDTIHGTSVCTPEAGEQQKRSILRVNPMVLARHGPSRRPLVLLALRPKLSLPLCSVQWRSTTKIPLATLRQWTQLRCLLRLASVVLNYLGTSVLSYLGAYIHIILTCACMWPHARMPHDQRIAAELAIRTPATIHPNPRISGFAADLAAECAENRRGFSPPPTSGIPLRLWGI